MFESSVNSYDSQTNFVIYICLVMFESSVNSYDSQTCIEFFFDVARLRVV